MGVGGRRSPQHVPDALARRTGGDESTGASSLTAGGYPATWIEWMETCGVDLFGCDENCSASRNVFVGAALRAGIPMNRLHHHSARLAEQDKNNNRDQHLGEVEYAAMHDEFLESLLYEQTMESEKEQLQRERIVDRTPSTISSTTVMPPPHHQQQRRHTTIGAAHHSHSPKNLLDHPPPRRRNSGGSGAGGSSPSPRKRRRSIRLPRPISRSSWSISSSKVAPLQTLQQQPQPPRRGSCNTTGGVGGKHHSHSHSHHHSHHGHHHRSHSHDNHHTHHHTHRRSSSSDNIRQQQQHQPRLSASYTTLSLDDLKNSSHHYRDPSTYVHVQCRMQKDRGRGEDIGSNICAKGRDPCLDKLRAKMRLLTDVVLDPNKGPATMKRRKAKVSQHLDNFVETRSLLELKMGFLSMTYGVLLRWDTGRTGNLATLVVLRKMCHESFYPSSRSNNRGSGSGRSSISSNHSKSASFDSNTALLMSSMSSSSQCCNQSFSHVSDVVDTNHAIIQRHDGATEVTLLEPPYRVPRPDTFEPSVFSAHVLCATGLPKRSNWTVKLLYDGKSENILLSWDTAKQCFMPKLGEPLARELSTDHDVRLKSSLEIRLYEHRLRRRSYRRLITTMNVPLGNLEPRSSSEQAPPFVRLNIPCKHDEDASIALGLNFVSDYGHWINKELEMRRREEVMRFRWKKAFTMSDLQPHAGISNGGDEDGLDSYSLDDEYVGFEDDEEENRELNNYNYYDPWDWICNVC